MPTENDIPPQYRRVRISTIDDDELLNKLAELEKTTKEEMEAMREEIRSLKALIHKLVDDQGVVVSSRPTPKKRRLVQISEADDDDSEDMMIPHMPVMQNGPIPSQSPLDDDDNEKEDAGHEEEQDDNDNVNDNDNNDGDAVGDAGKEVVEDDNDQEMQEEYQPPNSYGEELFDESGEISIEKTSSYPGISTSDLPSSFFISPQPQQPQQQQQPEPQQQQSEQQQQQPEPQQQQPEPQQQQPEPQQQQPEPQQQQPEPQQQQQQPKQQQPEPQQQQQQPKQQQSEQQQQQPEQQQQQQQPKQERPQYDLSSKLTTVNDVWIEWKVGDDCIEKQIERYGDEWCYNGDSSTFLKKQVLIQEIEYIVKKCETDDDYDTKCQKAIEALEARRKERGSLNRLCSLIKAFQNCAEQAVGFDGTGERDSYVSI